MAFCHSMGQRQLEPGDDSVEQDRGLSNSAVNDLSCETRRTTETLVQSQVAYISLKRVSLIHEGSIRTRPELAGLLHLVRQREIPGYVLFWHTGGEAALFG